MEIENVLHGREKPVVIEDTVADAAAWLKAATEQAGSWWEDWAAWTVERSGAERPAPTRAGSRKHPTLDAAPGLYVHE